MSGDFNQMLNDDLLSVFNNLLDVFLGGFDDLLGSLLGFLIVFLGFNDLNSIFLD